MISAPPEGVTGKRMFPGRRSSRLLIPAIVVGLAAASCGRAGEDAAPTIEFVTAPAAGPGGSDRMAAIAGRVRGARAGDRIVLYAKSGIWWLQPYTAQPFTTIGEDGAWKNTTHLGTEYAALLVGAAYRPPVTADNLPQAGGAVRAVAIVRGSGDFGTRPVRTISFSGYEWEVRGTPSDRGGPNDYDTANAWTDADGFLHLKLSRRNDRWTSAEVSLTRSLGYGTYAFVVRDVSQLEPSAAFGLFTWDDEGGDQNHRELDVEISRWGDPAIANAQYVVQPYYVAANVRRFAAPAGRLTHSFRWEPGRAIFRTMRGGVATSAPPVAEHAFTSGVPLPGNERVRMNLYYFRFSPTALQKEAEVIVEKFQYLP
jgi:hypothetical protein